MEVFCPGRAGTDYPPYDREQFELLASVCVPLDSKRRGFTRFGFAVLPNDARFADLRATFNALCGEAGEAMPSGFRDRLGDYCPWHVTKPASWWVALLLHLGNIVAMRRDGTYESHHLLPRPFLLSVDAIERCGLNTDQPDFIFEPLDPVEYLSDFSTTTKLFPSEAARLQTYLKRSPTGDEADRQRRTRLQEILAFNAELPPHPPNVPAIVMTPRECRDKWIYGECMKGTPYQTIAIRLKKKPKKWPPVGSVNGIKAAAIRYAERHSLPKPPARQAGRPPG